MTENIQSPLVVSFGVLIFASMLVFIVIEIVYELRREEIEIIFPAAQMRVFASAAVVTDATPCSTVGKDILRNGTIIDAAIATLFCTSVYRFHSSGLGGGFFMTFYLKMNKYAFSIDAWETAPAKAKPDLYEGQKEVKQGGLAVAVPGTVKGLWVLHQKHGTLPWKDLLQPAIKLCEKGFRVDPHLALVLDTDKNNILNEDTLREAFVHQEKVKKLGDVIKLPRLERTLKVIAEKGGDELYTGDLAKGFVHDVNVRGGILTLEDLQNYHPVLEQSAEFKVTKQYDLYSTPFPGSGYILGFVLEILRGFGFNNSSIKTVSDAAETYQKIVEAFKHGFARAPYVEDSKNSSIAKSLLTFFSDPTEAFEIRKRIKENKTFGIHYYTDKVLNKRRFSATTQVCIVDHFGNALAVTSSISSRFGAGFMAPFTGIIPNNAMSDFYVPKSKFRSYAYKSVNEIVEGRRPMSVMSPSVLVDSKTGDAVLVLAATGGAKILTSQILVIMNIIYFGMNIKTAIDQPRLHHQLQPNILEYEEDFPEAIVNKLKEFGHSIKKADPRITSSVVGIQRIKNQILYVCSDYRKGGDSAGYDDLPRQSRAIVTFPTCSQCQPPSSQAAIEEMVKRCINCHEPSKKCFSCFDKDGVCHLCPHEQMSGDYKCLLHCPSSRQCITCPDLVQNNSNQCTTCVKKIRRRNVVSDIPCITCP